METSSKLDGLECEQLSEEDMNFLKKLWDGGTERGGFLYEA
jgi:hypothetical protein